MGFGGGGGASSGVSAHKHTNATGEGGSLDNTSLMNDEGLMGQIVAFS